MTRLRAVTAAATALAVVAVGLAPSIGAGRSKRAPCRPAKGQELVEATSRAVIVRGRSGGGGSREFYACARKAGKMVFIGERTSDFAGGTDLEFRLGGTYVAQVKVLSDGREGSGSRTLSIIDLRARNGGGRPSFSGSTNRNGRSRAIEAFVMAPNGVAAFTAVTDGAAAQVELFALSAGGPVKLDAAPDLAADSLALAGRRLYWMKGGVPQSTELTAVPSSGR